MYSVSVLCGVVQFAVIRRPGSLPATHGTSNLQLIRFAMSSIAPPPVVPIACRVEVVAPPFLGSQRLGFSDSLTRFTQWLTYQARVNTHNRYHLYNRAEKYIIYGKYPRFAGCNDCTKKCCNLFTHKHLRRENGVGRYGIHA